MSTASLTYLRDYLTSTLTPTNMIWLSAQLEEYAERQEMPYVGPRNKEEMNAMLDEAERQIAAGETIPHEEVMRKWEEELALEEELEIAGVA